MKGERKEEKHARIRMVSTGFFAGQRYSYSRSYSSTHTSVYLRYLSHVPFLRYVPRGTQGTPREVANVAAFLSSDASSLINGADIFADGGTSGCTYGP